VKFAGGNTCSTMGKPRFVRLQHSLASVLKTWLFGEKNLWRLTSCLDERVSSSRLLVLLSTYTAGRRCEDWRRE